MSICWTSLPRNSVSWLGSALQTTITTWPSGRRKLRFSLPPGSWTEPRYFAPLSIAAVVRQGSSNSAGMPLARIKPFLSSNGRETMIASTPCCLAATSLRTNSVARALSSSRPCCVESSGCGGGSIVIQRSVEPCRGRETKASNFSSVNVGSGVSCSKSQVASAGDWLAPSQSQGTPSFTCWPKRNRRLRISEIFAASLGKPTRLVSWSLPSCQ